MKLVNPVADMHFLKMKYYLHSRKCEVLKNLRENRQQFLIRSGLLCPK